MKGVSHQSIGQVGNGPTHNTPDPCFLQNQNEETVMWYFSRHNCHGWRLLPWT
jgi:hypothetical protein